MGRHGGKRNGGKALTDVPQFTKKTRHGRKKRENKTGWKRETFLNPTKSNTAREKTPQDTKKEKKRFGANW